MEENKQFYLTSETSEQEKKHVESLDSSKFKFRNDSESLHDQAFETKPISYLHDCFNRFVKNKSSIVAFFIILIIALYAIIVPISDPKAHVNSTDFPNGYRDYAFRYATPYNSTFAKLGVWDGKKEKTVSEATYYMYAYDDSNHTRADLVSKEETRTVIGSVEYVTTSYVIKENTYYIGNRVVTVSESDYNALINYEKENNIYQVEGKSIMKPLIDSAGYLEEYRQTLLDNGETASLVDNVIDQMSNYYNQNPTISYALSAYSPTTGRLSQNTFYPVLDDNGEPVRIYQTDENGDLVYYTRSSAQYSIRVDYFDYFVYHYGFEPYGLFGMNAQGQDIFLRLAQGTRFSLLIGVGISLLNFIIGLVWGAVSGYYGGKTDLIMERITDIIGNVPSIIILTICQIQFVNSVKLQATLGTGGVLILAILVAFVYNGWIGVASTTRMQFYRFKNQEYVLASRTLGAKDRRLIFRHILPNAIGTLVTSCILMIPSVIFSESSLSYLGIINFSTSGLSSIGTMLDEGKQAGLSANPHVLLFPCVIISLLMISFNLFGNGLRDAFNTSLKGSED